MYSLDNDCKRFCWKNLHLLANLGDVFTCMVLNWSIQCLSFRPMDVFRGGGGGRGPPNRPRNVRIFFHFLFLHCLSNIGNDTSELYRNSNRNSLFWGDVCRPNAAVLTRRDDCYCREMELGSCHWTQSHIHRVADVLLERWCLHITLLSRTCT